MRKQLELIVKVIIYITFFVPLLVLPTSFIFPFIVPKILAFRSLVTLGTAGYILLLLINWKDFRPRVTPVTICVTAFLISFAVSTFVGTDPYHSFWDNHERMLGLFTIIHYVLYYYICTNTFKKWTDWQWALRVFLVAGSIAMCIGVLQVGNPDLLLNQGSDRVASTLGNPIYVGGYGLFLMFVAALLFLRERSIVWRWVEVALGILGALGMFYSGTRGSMLGLVAGGGTMLIGYALLLKEYPRTRKTLWAVAILGVLLVVVLHQYRQTDFVRNIPAVGRAINTSLADVEGSARFIAWRIAITSWRERPVFGWGPNNFFYAFNQHYNARSLNFGYGETWFDNAHNIVVNTLAVQGIVGLISYLSLFIVSIASLIISYRRRKVNMHLVIIGSAFLVAHLVQNVTVFENPTSYLYFAFWLAFINQSTTEDLASTRASVVPNQSSPIKPLAVSAVSINRSISNGSIIAVSVVAAIFIFLFNIQPGRANIKTLKALRALAQSPADGIQAAREALAFNSPHIDDIRNDISRSATNVLSESYQKLGKDKNMELYTMIHEALLENLKLHPLDIRIHLQLAQLLQTQAQVTNDIRYISEAESILTTAKMLSPRRQQLVYSLSAIKAELGKTQEAAQLLGQGISDNPAIGESYWRLAYLFKLLGDTTKVNGVMQLAAQNHVVFSPQEQTIIAQILTPMATSSSAGSKK